MTQQDLIRRGIGVCVLMLIALTVQAQQTPLQQAIDNPQRSEADRARDLRDKPLEVLNLLDLPAGAQVADVFGGGGYYSELMSYWLGLQGKVLLRNNQPYADYAKKDWQRRLANGRLGNVENAIVSNTDLQLPAAALDAVLLMMTFHDLYYAEAKHDWKKVDVTQFLGQLLASLKPGGLLLLTDHAATVGSAASVSKSLHRIEESYAQQQIVAAGFELVATDDALRNAQDDRQLMVFDAAIRGKTDRFVHLYRKPAQPSTARRFFY
ncbi:MAG: class I SAM-dependent methyltransferase [Oceanococcus sp.]